MHFINQAEKIAQRHVGAGHKVDLIFTWKHRDMWEITYRCKDLNIHVVAEIQEGAAIAHFVQMVEVQERRYKMESNFNFMLVELGLWCAFIDEYGANWKAYNNISSGWWVEEDVIRYTDNGLVDGEWYFEHSDLNCRIVEGLATLGYVISKHCSINKQRHLVEFRKISI